MNEPNTIESDETSNNNELRLSSGSSSDSSYASESSSSSEKKKRKPKSYKLILNRLKEPVGENTKKNYLGLKRLLILLL
jgi:hypothetical protein